ncbi:hypothetical protein Pelo_10532 [Pelomyxa schiedti]|nr:hypothetical protein Pelo_10532 [Pelomyxa schiedti]
MYNEHQAAQGRQHQSRQGPPPPLLVVPPRQQQQQRGGGGAGAGVGAAASSSSSFPTFSSSPSPFGGATAAAAGGGGGGALGNTGDAVSATGGSTNTPCINNNNNSNSNSGSGSGGGADDVAQSVRLLPLVAEMLVHVRDQKDRPATAAAAAFFEEIERVRKMVDGLSGIDISLEEQHLLEEELKATLKKKTELLEKYKQNLEELIAESPVLFTGQS